MVIKTKNTDLQSFACYLLLISKIGVYISLRKRIEGRLHFVCKTMNWTSFVCEETPVSSQFFEALFSLSSTIILCRNSKLTAISPQSSSFLTSVYLKTGLPWILRQASLEKLG